MELAKHHQVPSILAYEMNGEPLGVSHGAPLRLRVETQLGFKMVKWISHFLKLTELSKLRLELLLLETHQ